MHNNQSDDHDSLRMLWYLDKIEYQRENDKFYCHYKGLDPERLEVPNIEISKQQNNMFIT
jgi:hypothetical protein